jgi:hypothetical protein
MTPEGLLDEIDTLLREERAALRVLDATRAEALAERKTELVTRLASVAGTRRDLAPRIGATTKAIRDNCVLLAHARHCVRDATAAVARELNRRGGAPPATLEGADPLRRGVRVSLKG